MKNKICSVIVVMIGALLLTSCSVFMAANHKGEDMTKLSTCKTKECLIAKGATVISSKKDKNGYLTEEVYQIRKPTGSTPRALMHGLLDISTLGIWEVVGTPMELVLNKKEMCIFKVIYKNKGEEIQAVQLAQ
jgi:hypothetical protein